MLAPLSVPIGNWAVEMALILLQKEYPQSPNRYDDWLSYQTYSDIRQKDSRNSGSA